MASRTLYWGGGSANWDGTAGSKWTQNPNCVDGLGEAIPTTEDDVNFVSASGVVTVTLAAGHTGCRSLNFTGVQPLFAFAGSAAMGTAQPIAGGLTLGASMTWSNTSAITFGATSGLWDINTAGVSMNNNITFNGVGGSWQLTSNYSIPSNRTITVTNGSFDLNDYNCSAGFFSSNNSNTRSVSLGNGTLTLIGASATPWNTQTTTGLTFAPEGSTVLYNANTASARTINAGGVTFNKFTFAGTGAGDLNVTSNFSAQVITLSDPPQEIVVTTGVTIAAQRWNISGTSGNANVFTSGTPGSPYTLNKVGGGFVDVDFVSLTDAVCTPAGDWFIGAGGTVGTNTTGATAAPAPAWPMRIGRRANKQRVKVFYS